MISNYSIFILLPTVHGSRATSIYIYSIYVNHSFLQLRSIVLHLISREGSVEYVTNMTLSIGLRCGGLLTVFTNGKILHQYSFSLSNIGVGRWYSTAITSCSVNTSHQIFANDQENTISPKSKSIWIDQVLLLPSYLFSLLTKSRERSLSQLQGRQR